MALCKTTDQDFGTVANAWNVVREETENRARFHSDLGDAINSAVATPLKARFYGFPPLLLVVPAALIFLQGAAACHRSQPQEGAHFFFCLCLSSCVLMCLFQGRDAAKKLLTDLNRTEKTLDEAKAKYERARKKQFECKDEYERASFNANGNPKVFYFSAHLAIFCSLDTASQLKEKLSKQLSSQHKAADQADTSYAEQVSKLQELQVKCYETEVPAVLADFERMERSRIDAVKSAFEQYVRLEERLAPLVTDSLLRMSAVVEALNAETDVVEFVRLTKSGQMPPARAQVGLLGEVFLFCALTPQMGSITRLTRPLGAAWRPRPPSAWASNQAAVDPATAARWWWWKQGRNRARVFFVVSHHPLKLAARWLYDAHRRCVSARRSRGQWRRLACGVDPRVDVRSPRPSRGHHQTPNHGQMRRPLRL